MGYVWMGTGIVVSGLLWRVWRRRPEQDAEAVNPAWFAHDKMQFICDLCDGNRRKAAALVAEKMAQNASLSHAQAIEQVHAAMQVLIEDEHSAIVRYGERRGRQDGRRRPGKAGDTGPI